MFPPVLIAMVSNLDNLGVGIAYGIRGTRIAKTQNLVIALITMAGTAAAMTSGRAISTLIAPSIGGSLGSLIVIGIGVASVVGSLATDPVARRRGSRRAASSNRRRDSSESISCPEAVVLGVALSLNNVGTGIGAGLAGIAPLPTSLLAGALSFLFIGGASVAAAWLGLFRDGGAQLVSGVVLVAVGTTMLSGAL